MLGRLDHGRLSQQICLLDVGVCHWWSMMHIFNARRLDWAFFIYFLNISPKLTTNSSTCCLRFIKSLVVTSGWGQ